MIYSLSKAVCSMIFCTIYRWRVYGRENIPKVGPAIICSNHISYWDPPLVGCASSRKVYFMAKEELFCIPVLGPLIRSLGAFPVKRGTPDRTAIRRALQLLESGNVVGMFPEGTRGRNIEGVESGAAFLALRAGCPVVPAVIKNGYKPFRSVEIRFGRPLDVGDKKERVRTEDTEEISQRIMNSMIELMAGTGEAQA